MADFALLAKAAEPALGWPCDAALNALRRNMRGAASMLADLDPVAIVIRQLIEDEPTRRFAGLVSGLYARLNGIADPDIKHAPGWPKGPPKLGEHLRRIAPALRSVGIAFNEARTKKGAQVTIEAEPDYVGKADSLFESGEEDGDGEPPATPSGEVNSGPYLPTPPTPRGGNGGIPELAPESTGVSGVGRCKQDAGTAYTDKPLMLQVSETDGVGSAGKNPPAFMPAPRRIVL